MDKKKKIIVAIVGIACLILIVVVFKIVVFPAEKTKTRKNQLSISTPEVIKDKIENKSKIEHYDRESLKSFGKNDVVKGFGNVGKEAQEIVQEESLIVGENSGQEQEGNNLLGALGKGGHQSQGRSAQSYQKEAEDEELRQLMALQEQLLAQAEAPARSESDAAEAEEIQKLLAAYSQYSQEGIPNFQVQFDENGQPLTPEKITDIGTSVSQKIASQINTQFQSQNFFHGAQSSKGEDKVLGLIPAETVDDGVLVNGSTIAIRTKKEIRISTPQVLIPKGAVVYGRVSFGTNRLLINITSYKTRDKLYQLNFTMFDFDGIEGIHLDNRTWPKIPGKVTKDVYDYAYQKGTQASTFGSGDTGVNLDEARDIAILSAAKEIGNEVFEKRRVFMPKKYHLWLNIKTK
ncbi:conjugative transposon protein TraM [Aquimarina pacifica]|uniref:conjugative transposon protein TraM n=1 Tax=Aquimarina pacifica TaxID=1296415 RepID=UPI0004717354|nr:conjugative transposon protein TraM [Aquimarina pacifica]